MNCQRLFLSHFSKKLNHSVTDKTLWCQEFRGLLMSEVIPLSQTVGFLQYKLYLLLWAGRWETCLFICSELFSWWYCILLTLESFRSAKAAFPWSQPADSDSFFDAACPIMTLFTKTMMSTKSCKITIFFLSNQL